MWQPHPQDVRTLPLGRAAQSVASIEVERLLRTMSRTLGALLKASSAIRMGVSRELLGIVPIDCEDRALNLGLKPAQELLKTTAPADGPHEPRYSRLAELNIHRVFLPFVSD